VGQILREYAQDDIVPRMSATPDKQNSCIALTWAAIISI